MGKCSVRFEDEPYEGRIDIVVLTQFLVQISPQEPSSLLAFDETFDTLRGVLAWLSDWRAMRVATCGRSVLRYLSPC
jgi:hypothetical protein